MPKVYLEEPILAFSYVRLCELIFFQEEGRTHDICTYYMYKIRKFQEVKEWKRKRYEALKVYVGASSTESIMQFSGLGI
jgi:hypothetical protein